MTESVFPYKHTNSQGKEYTITKEHIMLWEMAGELNTWLMSKGDNTKGYQNRIDLVCDIKQILEKGLEKSNEKIETIEKEHKDDHTRSVGDEP